MSIVEGVDLTPRAAGALPVRPGAEAAEGFAALVGDMVPSAQPDGAQGLASAPWTLPAAPAWPGAAADVPTLEAAPPTMQAQANAATAEPPPAAPAEDAASGFDMGSRPTPFPVQPLPSVAVAVPVRAQADLKPDNGNMAPEADIDTETEAQERADPAADVPGSPAPDLWPDTLPIAAPAGVPAPAKAEAQAQETGIASRIAAPAPGGEPRASMTMAEREAGAADVASSGGFASLNAGSGVTTEPGTALLRPASLPGEARPSPPATEPARIMQAYAQPAPVTVLPPSPKLIAATVASQAAGGEREILIRLNPEELGRIEVRLVEGRHGVQATLYATEPKAIELLGRDTPDLRAAFADSGIRLDAVRVEPQLDSSVSTRLSQGQAGQGGQGGGAFDQTPRHGRRQHGQDGRQEQARQQAAAAEAIEIGIGRVNMVA